MTSFEKIFNMVKTFYKETPKELVRTILMFTIAISFEIKVGSAVKQQFSNINSNEEYQSIIYTSKLMNDDNGYYVREFDTRYFLNSKSEYRFFKFVENYVRTRTFNERMFNENMESALNPKKQEVEPEYTKLLNGTYWKLSDFDFSVLIDQVLLDAKDGKIPSKEYTKLFSVYKYLCEIGIVRYYIEEIKDKFLFGYKLALGDEVKNNVDIEVKDATANNITDDECK